MPDQNRETLRLVGWATFASMGSIALFGQILDSQMQPETDSSQTVVVDTYSAGDISHGIGMLVSATGLLAMGISRRRNEASMAPQDAQAFILDDQYPYNATERAYLDAFVTEQRQRNNHED